MTHTEHTYETQLTWSGSTGAGYAGYDRSHTAVAPPSTMEIRLSADPVFRGDADLTNPEQLLVMAASSCQLLSFLAVAARHKVDVLGYEDEAVGVMSADVTPMRITAIALSPQIVVAAGTDVRSVEQMAHEAHELCFIANSLISEVTVVPTVVTHA
jgi:organic hydroperoxide reductase OsmC/OhrA